MTPRPVVILCTRDRPQSCRQALSSLLAARRVGCQIIVVDQTADERTHSALRLIPGAPEAITYVRSPRRGLSAARNDGVKLADGDLLLFTDDDCRVEPDWVEAWCRGLEGLPMIGMAFGAVASPAVDRRAGFVSEFCPTDRSFGIELFRRRVPIGIGANMALRREALDRVGPFDEGLGAGTPVAAGEELDFAYRVVRAGYQVGHLTAPRVWHDGYRAGVDATRLYAGYVTGTASMHVKHARCGDRVAAALILGEVAGRLGYLLRSSLTGRRPLGARSLASYLTAAMASWRRPLDRRRRLYRAEDNVWPVEARPSEVPAR